MSEIAERDAREKPTPIPGFDAMEWVKLWRETIADHPEIPTDDGTMLTWFSCAIMRGYDEHARRYPPSAAAPRES